MIFIPNGNLFYYFCFFFPSSAPAKNACSPWLESSTVENYTNDQVCFIHTSNRLLKLFIKLHLFNKLHQCHDYFAILVIFVGSQCICHELKVDVYLPVNRDLITYFFIYSLT